MTDVDGSPELSGPEPDAHSPDNSVELMWASADELGRLSLTPEHLRTDLPELLGSARRMGHASGAQSRA